MLTCTCELIGLSDVMFGAKVREKKKDDETHEQHEERTWQQKVPVLESGQVYIQPFALKNALESAAQWLSLKIPGEGKKTFTKRFQRGIYVEDTMPLMNGNGKPLTIEDIDPQGLFVPSTGKRGEGTRVLRVFPTAHSWKTSAKITVLDNKITEEVLLKHLAAAGQFIGFGSMRVENGGINGRFMVENLKCEELVL